jgi:hypothetical protein
MILYDSTHNRPFDITKAHNSYNNYAKLIPHISIKHIAITSIHGLVNPS